MYMAVAGICAEARRNINAPHCRIEFFAKLDIRYVAILDIRLLSSVSDRRVRCENAPVR